MLVMKWILNSMGDVLAAMSDTVSYHLFINYFMCLLLFPLIPFQVISHLYPLIGPMMILLVSLDLPSLMQMILALIIQM